MIYDVMSSRFYWTLILIRLQKVAAERRKTVRRSGIRISVRKAGVRTIVPITTETQRADDVGIDEVRVASSVPLVADVVMQFPGEAPSQRLTPLIHPQDPV